MDYHTTYQATPPYINPQAIQTHQLNPTYVGDCSHPESCNMPYFPNYQDSFHPPLISNVSNNLFEGCTWSAEDTALALATLAEADPVDPLPQGQPTVQMQSAVVEHRAGAQGSGGDASVEARLCKVEDRISRLEDKVGEFKELMQNLQNE
jgi:hypothetical protein